jgi:hypothetical protein
MDLPSDIMDEINRDTERYRQMRITAALKRLTPGYLERKKKCADQEWVRNHHGEIVLLFASGESLEQICSRCDTIKPARIKLEIRDWLSDVLNRDFKWNDATSDWKNVPRFSETEWRQLVNELIAANPRYFEAENPRYFEDENLR